MGGKNICCVIHRRAGKDIFCVEAWLLRALTRIGTHVYLLPMATQAYSVIWKGMDFSGRPFLSSIPECLIKRKNEARMEIELINGSRMVLGGSNNVDALMGTNPVTIIYSEFSLHNPISRQYLNPILIQNGGTEIFQFTPRGQNHAYELMEIVRDNPKYFVQHMGVDDTKDWDGSRIITQEQIDDAKRMGMSEEMIQQEFYCNFEVGNVGAYFTVEINHMTTDGRITTLRPNPHLPIHTCWDLGGTDATAGWLFQLEGGFINLLHIIHSNNKPLKWYFEQAEMIRQKIGAPWGNHYGPHDIKNKHQNWETAESRLMKAREAGYNFQVTPKLSVHDGIEAIRYIFPKIRIDKTNCTIGLRAMREYQRIFDTGKGAYKKEPLENWAVHIVDALRYLAVNYRRLHDIPQAPIRYQSSL